MKAVGIVTRIGKNGELMIPKDVMRLLKVEPGTPMEYYMGVDEDGWYLAARRYNIRKTKDGLSAQEPI